MPTPPEAYRHPHETRPLIPAESEAGAEAYNPLVQARRARFYDLNPIVRRGQDPELKWLGKYEHDSADGSDQRPEHLRVDVRLLYRHEHVRPQQLLAPLYREKLAAASQLGLFGNDYNAVPEFDKPTSYYEHHGEWENRLILGDSLLTMTSLLEREGFAGKVQMIYLDPPYGIKYGSNWQIKLNNRTVQDGKDEHISAEPEQIKAFRDTWELGVHSYLSYLRDRLLVARELLTESGSCFVQISDENVHLVRCLMDEVFGAGNFVSLITFVTTAAQSADLLPAVSDYLLLYAKDKEQVKYHQVYRGKQDLATLKDAYSWLLLPDGTSRKATKKEVEEGPEEGKLYRLSPLTSQRPPGSFPFDFQGKTYLPGKQYWKTHKEGLERLKEINRMQAAGSTLFFRLFLDDFSYVTHTNNWTDTQASFGEKHYVVQTNQKVIQRCLLMTTDPGDLVIDPTCGSGTTAYVAEQWGRRWITTDTSRIALNIAKTRLMMASFPYYQLHDPAGQDVRQGFVYEEVPHITLKSLANDEPPATEKLYDKPKEDKKRLRVAGPFTVETLQSLNPVSPEELTTPDPAELESQQQFEQRIVEGLKSAGIMTGDKREKAVFLRVESRVSPNLPLEGWWRDDDGQEKKAYFLLGPRFGTVSAEQVSAAIREANAQPDCQWLVLLGFAFDSSIENRPQTSFHGRYQVTRVRLGDDLLQLGLTKKDKKAASFVSIGEPEIALHRLAPDDTPLVRQPKDDTPTRQKTRLEARQATAGQPATTYVRVEVKGLDIYDPIGDQLSARPVEDIAYWMVDDDYDGANFTVRQVFFCGSDDHEEFKRWRAKLDDSASRKTKQRAEATLRIELDEEAWERLYGVVSHPIAARPGQRIAVRVVSQFGEESTRVVTV